MVKEESWNTIQRDLNQRMPIYKASFQKTAEKYDLDWHLLAAISVLPDLRQLGALKLFVVKLTQVKNHGAA